MTTKIINTLTGLVLLLAVAAPSTPVRSLTMR